MKGWMFFFLLAGSVIAQAQTTVHGRVVDQQTGEPLEYAVVRNARGNSTMTDRQGNFRVAVREETDSLTISYVGYRSCCICAGECCTNPDCCRNGVCTRRQQIALRRQEIDMKAIVIAPAPNAGFHTISQVDLRLRPLSSPQDLMRLVPGLFLGQHQGGGLAEHIFFRGFDADHGTDVNVSVDGMPVNLVSHIHGQGFADLHFLIPELVSRYEYGKGPYYSEYGDFTTAGYVAFRTFDVLDRSEIKVEGGAFNTGRVMAKIDLLGPGALKRGENAWVAGEAAYTDGPFDWAQHLRRLNLYGKYNVDLSARTRMTTTISAFESSWRSSGEIPSRAVQQHLIGRFGYIDSTQGGSTGKTMVQVRLKTDLGRGWSIENSGYYAHYYFTLDYDPTFFAEDSVEGDRLRQQERRDLAGYRARVSKHFFTADGGDLLSAAGWGAQADHIGMSTLRHMSPKGQVLDTLQAGVPREHAMNAWIDENYHKDRWLINAGLRVDWMGFRYRDDTGPSMPGRGKVIASPKFNVSYTYSPSLQFYLKTGKGFHSNDARVVVANRGLDVLPAAYGADLGVNWKAGPRLLINAAVWTLFLQQEFVYDADEGTMEPGNRTRRQGVDLSARYQLTPWLFANLDVNLCKARALQSPKGQDYLPLAVPFCSTGGLDVKLHNGLSGGISYRYLKDRPASEDNSLVAKGYFVGDLTVNYRRAKWEAGLDVQNLFNTSWRETQFETHARMRGEAAPADDISFTPGTPFFAKLKFGVYF